MKETLAEMFNRHSLEPFVITTVDGFAIVIDNPYKVLLGLQMLDVATTPTGFITSRTGR